MKEKQRDSVAVIMVLFVSDLKNVNDKFFMSAASNSFL